MPRMAESAWPCLAIREPDPFSDRCCAVTGYGEGPACSRAAVQSLVVADFGRIVLCRQHLANWRAVAASGYPLDRVVWRLEPDPSSPGRYRTPPGPIEPSSYL